MLQCTSRPQASSMSGAGGGRPRANRVDLGPGTLFREGCPLVAGAHRKPRTYASTVIGPLIETRRCHCFFFPITRNRRALSSSSAHSSRKQPPRSGTFIPIVFKLYPHFSLREKSCPPLLLLAALRSAGRTPGFRLGAVDPAADTSLADMTRNDSRRRELLSHPYKPGFITMTRPALTSTTTRLLRVVLQRLKGTPCHKNYFVLGSRPGRIP